MIAFTDILKTIIPQNTAKKDISAQLSNKKSYGITGTWGERKPPLKPLTDDEMFEPKDFRTPDSPLTDEEMNAEPFMQNVLGNAKKIHEAVKKVPGLPEMIIPGFFGAASKRIVERPEESIESLIDIQAPAWGLWHRIRSGAVSYVLGEDKKYIGLALAKGDRKLSELPKVRSEKFLENFRGSLLTSTKVIETLYPQSKMVTNILSDAISSMPQEQLLQLVDVTGDTAGTMLTGGALKTFAEKLRVEAIPQDKMQQVKDIAEIMTPEEATAVTTPGGWGQYARKYGTEGVKKLKVKFGRLQAYEMGEPIQPSTMYYSGIPIPNIPQEFIEKYSLTPTMIESLGRGEFTGLPASVLSALRTENIIPAIEIPKFKTTEEALAFGKENKENPEVITELKLRREEALQRAESLKGKTDTASLQEGLNVATEAQLYREALEPIEKPIEGTEELRPLTDEEMFVDEYSPSILPQEETVPPVQIKGGERITPKIKQLEYIPAKLSDLKKIVADANEKDVDYVNVSRRLEFIKDEKARMKSIVPRIRPYLKGKEAEEFRQLLPEWKTKDVNAPSPDEAMDMLNNQGFNFQNENEMYEYLNRLSTGLRGAQTEKSKARLSINERRAMLLDKDIENKMQKEKNIIAEKAARAGYKLGKEEARTKTILKFNEKKLTSIEAKQLVTDFLRENLSPQDRGKFINTVKEIKTIEAAARAFSRIDVYAKKQELKKSISDLKNLTEKLEESPSVSADYRAKIKEIIGQYELSGHSKSTMEQLKNTQEYLNRQKATGEEKEIPQRILDKLKILTRIPKNNLTLKQVENLKYEIKLLANLGKTKWESKQALYEGEKSRRKNVLLETATPINSMRMQNVPIGEEPNKWIEKYIEINNGIQKSTVGLTPMDGLAEITGMKPLKAELDLCFGEYINRATPGVPEFYNLEKEMIELGEKLSEGQQNRVGVYGAKMQIGGYEKLLNSGITKENADAIVLTPEELKFYNAIQKFNEATYPAVKKYALDNKNIDIGKVENYMSYMTDYDAMNDLEIFDRIGDRAETALTKNVNQSMLQKRVGAGTQKIQLNALKIARRHADDVAYMLTMGRAIKMNFEIVNSPEMRDKLGDVGAIAWIQWLDLMARKGGTDGAKRIAALDIWRKNLGAGVLSFRLSSTLVQLSSFADTIGTIGAEWATRGATSIATSKEWRNFIMDNFPEIRKAVGDDIAFREFGQSFFDRLTRIGFTPLQKLDGIMRSTAAAGAYQKIADEKNIPIDFTNPSKELIQEATSLMRQSQGSSFFKDQPLALTAGYGIFDNKSINKTIFTFQSFMINRWDNINRQIWRLGIKEKKYTKAGLSFLWLVIFSAAVEEGLRRGSRGLINIIAKEDKYDKKEKDFVHGMGINILQSVPIAGQLVSSLTYSSNPVPIFNAFEQGWTGMKNIIVGKHIETKARGAVRAIGAIGSLAGIPGISQASQIAKGMIPDTKAKKNSKMSAMEKKYGGSTMDRLNKKYGKSVMSTLEKRYGAQ